MARFIPPPRMRPVGGYASTTEAVMALVEQGGKKPREIAEQLGTSTETVRGIIQRARTERRTTGIEGLPADRAADLREIYRRTLVMISEARGVDAETLHALFRGTHIKNTESGEARPLAEPVVPEVSPSSDLGDATKTVANVNLVERLNDTKFPEPEPAPMMQMRPASQVTYDERVSSGLVTLRNAAGDYLSMDGSGITTNRAHAYRGTLTQAKAMRKAKPIAASMKISHFSPRRPT